MKPCFIVAGGPSVAAQNLELLRGHEVIAINDSFERVPFAQTLFFGDHLYWWRERGSDVLGRFAGEIVTSGLEFARSKDSARVTVLKRSSEFSLDPESVFVGASSVNGAINLAWHRWGNRRPCVLLGVDGDNSPDGQTHHYQGRERQPMGHNWQRKQARDFETVSTAAKSLGLEILNASPASVYEFWPKVDLEAFV